MYKIIAVVGMFLFFANVGNSYADDKELDNDLMRSIEDTNKSLASNIALKDRKASSTDAKELIKMFVEVERFFVDKGNANDAVELSKKISELSVEIDKSVNANDFERATGLATSLSRTCKTCHNFYKKS